MFRVISDSYESKSLILTTNLEFSKWGGVFTDDQMAAAMIDRLVHHGHLFFLLPDGTCPDETNRNYQDFIKSCRKLGIPNLKKGNFDADLRD